MIRSALKFAVAFSKFEYKAAKIAAALKRGC
jgi:hypothetical protein